MEESFSLCFSGNSVGSSLLSDNSVDVRLDVRPVFNLEGTVEGL